MVYDSVSWRVMWLLSKGLPFSLGWNDPLFKGLDMWIGIVRLHCWSCISWRTSLILLDLTQRLSLLSNMLTSSLKMRLHLQYPRVAFRLIWTIWGLWQLMHLVALETSSCIGSWDRFMGQFSHRLVWCGIQCHWHWSGMMILWVFLIMFTLLWWWLRQENNKARNVGRDGFMRVSVIFGNPSSSSWLAPVTFSYSEIYRFIWTNKSRAESLRGEVHAKVYNWNSNWW